MSDGGNNIYKYMTSDRKLNGENSKSQTRSMIEYFEKSTGVFNGDGFISQQELKAIQERAKANKMLWHGFVSLNEEMSSKIDTPEKCMRLIKRTFGEFFRDMRLDSKNIDLICSLHKDKPHHLHIHFWFAEKAPKCKYRKKELEYRHKGKISKPVLDRMHVRLNSYVCGHEERLYMTRDEALRELKKITFPKSIVSENEVRKALIDLAKKIPRDASFFYGKRDMEPYREQVDETVKKILLFDRRARKADRAFHERLAKYETDIFAPFAKDIIKTDLFKKEFIDPLQNRTAKHHRHRRAQRGLQAPTSEYCLTRRQEHQAGDLREQISAQGQRQRLKAQACHLALQSGQAHRRISVLVRGRKRISKPGLHQPPARD